MQSTKLTEHKQAARDRLTERGVPLHANFFALDAETVERVEEAAKAHKYRQPKGSMMSRARQFYTYATRGIEE